MYVYKFLHNPESLVTLNQTKKNIDVTLILFIIAKKKYDLTRKQEKLFWCFVTLIAFVIAYNVSIVQTGFLIANMCVCK